MAGHKDLDVFKLSHDLAMKIYKESMRFPREEKYSLTDQVRRSSRSVCANLAEGYGKRRYPKHFTSKLTDAESENFETQIWLDFALSCEYISTETHQALFKQSERVGSMLGAMLKNPEKFTPRNK